MLIVVNLSEAAAKRESKVREESARTENLERDEPALQPLISGLFSERGMAGRGLTTGKTGLSS